MAWTSESVPSTGSNWTAEVVPSFIGWAPEIAPSTAWKHTGHFGWAITSTETGSITYNTSFAITITFDEPVVDFDLTDFSLINCVISSLSGSGKVYTATCTRSYYGQLTVAISDGVVTDDKGHKNSIGTPFSINVKVSQFETEWTLGAGEYTIRLPLVNTGSYNFDIDWGDGNTDTITTWNQVLAGETDPVTHTYASTGVKEVKLGGPLNYEIEGWQFYNQYDKDKITSISKWGPLILNTTRSFYGCGELTTITAPDAPVIDTTDLSNTFQSCVKLTSLGTGGNVWDVSSVTNMDSMFQGCSVFNGDITAWNTGDVTDMSYMFGWTNAVGGFNQPIGSWNVSKVEHFETMFLRAQSFNQSLSGWNTSSGINMNSMFNYASAFNQDIGNWDVSNVEDMSDMFLSTPNFNGNIGNWGTKTGEVTNMAGMFQSATSFNQDLSSWDVSKVTSLTQTFYGATDFNGNIGSWVTSAVTHLYRTFRGATDFNQDIGDWNTSLVTSMLETFTGATSFDQDISAWDVNQVTTFVDFMSGANALSSANYNLLLHHWEDDNPLDNKAFHGGDAIPDASSGGVDGLAARAKLELPTADGGHGWTITDGQYSHSSLLLNGINQYMDVGDITQLNSASTYTISYWIYHTSTATAECNLFDTVCGKFTGGSRHYCVANSGDMMHYISTPGAVAYAASPLHSDNVWEHWTFVFDGGLVGNARLKLYFNGALLSGADVYYSAVAMPATSPDMSGENWDIGMGNYGAMIGNLDDFAIWSTALSDATVTSNYNLGKTKDLSSSPNLIGYWKFEEGTGTSVVNTANPGTYDGTLINSAGFGTNVP